MIKKCFSRLFFCVMFLSLFSGSLFNGSLLFGLSLEDFVSPEQVRALLAGENPVSTQFGNSRPALVPRHEFLSGLVAQVRQDLNPNVMVETLQIYHKPPDAENGSWSTDEEASIYNSLIALSTLAGLQYYSESRGEMRTFYETSSVVDGPSTRRPLSDPVYSRPPAELTVYARQKDLTFGDNTYKYDYYSLPGSIIFAQENLTSLNYGIIPAVGRNRLRTIVAVIDAGEHLIIYAISMARAASIPGMNDRIGNSFTNRARAVIKWFSEQADRAYRRVHL